MLALMALPRTPALTVDIIIELYDRADRPIVLVERRNPPHGWALPGGFVDIGETVPAAAIREAREETGLAVDLRQLLGCYSDPRRDPRGHTASIVYIAGAEGVPAAADDARAVKVFAVEQLPTTTLVFDHRWILADYLIWREKGRLPPPFHGQEK